MITYKLYHRLRKFARGNIDFIEDFSLGHAEYPPPKWQSRDSAVDPNLHASSASLRASFVVPAICFAVVFAYAVAFRRARR